MQYLHEDLLIYILALTTFQDIIRLSQVNQRWYQLSLSEKLWKLYILLQHPTHVKNTLFLEDARSLAFSIERNYFLSFVDPLDGKIRQSMSKSKDVIAACIYVYTIYLKILKPETKAEEIIDLIAPGDKKILSSTITNFYQVWIPGCKYRYMLISEWTNFGGFIYNINPIVLYDPPEIYLHTIIQTFKSIGVTEISISKNTA